MTPLLYTSYYVGVVNNDMKLVRFVHNIPGLGCFEPVAVMLFTKIREVQKISEKTFNLWKTTGIDTVDYVTAEAKKIIASLNNAHATNPTTDNSQQP